MRWLTNIPLRIRSLLRSAEVDEELSNELHFHVEQQIEENRAAGMSDREARQAALRAMGGLAQLQEECRDARNVKLATDLVQDLRYASRVLRKSPTFSIVAIATLGLGIGATTAAFSAVNSVLFRPLPLPFADRVTSIRIKPPLAGETGTQASPAQFLAWRAASGPFDMLGAAVPNRVQVTEGSDVGELRSLQASAELLQLAGIRPDPGRAFRPDDFASGAPLVCLISHGLWQRRFSSDRDVIGRVLYVDAQPTTIIGVLPANAVFPDAESDIWTPLQFSPAHQRRRSLDVYGRLKPGVQTHDAQVWLDQVTGQAESELPDWLRSRGAVVNTIREQLISHQETLLMVLVGIAACVLLVCCANVGNLLLARYFHRSHEIGLRSSIGATWRRLVRQFLAEALLLCIIGACAGLATGRGLISLGSEFLGDSRFRALIDAGNRALDGRVAAFATILLLSTTVLFALIPCLHFKRVNLNEVLRSSPREARHGFSAGGWLVALELAAAFVLLTGAGLLTRSFVGLLFVDRGYSVDHLLTARLPAPRGVPPTLAGRKQLFQDLTAKLAGLPGVRAAGVVTGLPLGGLNASVTLPRPGQPLDPENLPWAAINCISPGYFRAMGISIVQGRDFDVHDNQVAMRVAIVNETLAHQFWPGRDAIGQEVTPGVRVVGIARDIRQEALDSRQGPAFYLPFDQRDGLAAAPNFVVVRTDGDPRDVVPTLKSVVRSVDARQPVVDIQTMEEVLGRSIVQRRLLMSLMVGFAALAVLLSTAGIYGVLSYIVADRTREIGIRMCLGARSSGIVALVARQLLGPVASGLLAGLAVSLLAARVLSHWLFSVRPHDVITLISAAALTAAIAILGGAIPIIRAVRVDPISAVRME